MRHRLTVPMALLALPLALLALTLLPTPGPAQGTHGGMHRPHGAAASGGSPYAGEETRAIKALSNEELTGLLEGAGLGFAKAAELNHYPGPRHVLELAPGLELDDGQRAAAAALYAAMRELTMALGASVVERERELDARFAAGSMDAVTLERLTAEIGRLQGALRNAHLATHLEMKRLLTPEQVAAYDRLRGYAAP